MLAAVGAITGERRDEAHALVEQISKRTIMRDLFAHAREYWENQSGTGLIKPENQAE